MTPEQEDTLLARIARLEATVGELRHQLTFANPAGFRAMRDSRRCPACDSGSLLHIRRIEDAMRQPLALHHMATWAGAATHAPLEAFVCRTCRLVEWHAIELVGVEPDGDTVVEIEPEDDPPTEGPYR